MRRLGHLSPKSSDKVCRPQEAISRVWRFRKWESGAKEGIGLEER